MTAFVRRPLFLASLALAVLLLLLRAASCAKPPPAPASTTTTADVRATTTTTAAAEHREQSRGPVHTTARTVTRRPDGTTVTRTTVRDEGAGHDVTDRTEMQQAQAQETRTAERRTTPAAASASPARWALSLSADNALAIVHGAAPSLRAGVGLRLLGPLWARVTFSPPLLGRGELGAGAELAGDSVALAIDLDNAAAVAFVHAAPALRATGSLRLLGPLWGAVSVAPPAPLGRGELGAGISLRF